LASEEPAVTWTGKTNEQRSVGLQSFGQHKRVEHIDGLRTLTQNGAGSVTLAGTNTSSGAVSINAGTLALAGLASLNNNTSITIAAGAVLDVSARTDARYRWPVRKR